MGLVPQLDHSSPLGRQISTGIQGAQGFVGDLKEDNDLFLFFTGFTAPFPLFLIYNTDAIYVLCSPRILVRMDAANLC